MIFRTSEQEIKQYEQSTAINQSLLKKLLSSGIHTFLKERNLSGEEREKNNKQEHFLLGHAVDCIITYGIETFEKKYFISQLAKKPSETIMNIIKQVFDEAQQAFEKLGAMQLSAPALNVLLNEAITIFEYQKNWKAETKLAKVIEQGGEYWEDLKSSLGKVILSDTQATNILTIANNMLNHKHTAGLFKDSVDIDIIYQQPLYFKYLETDCKALPDLIRINHKTKKIYPLDCKTTFDSVLNFKFALKSYKYDIQASYYVEAVKQNMAYLSKLIEKDLAGYEIADFGFIVESTVNPGTPMIYVVDKDLLLKGQYGDSRGYGNFKGFHQGIELYQQWEVAEFDIEKFFKDTKGMNWIEEDYDYRIVC